MPFICLHNGDRVCSIDYTPSEWSNIKKDHSYVGGLKCPYCNSNMVCVTNNNNTQFYRHVSNNNCDFSGGESKEHLKLKKDIYECCKKYNIDCELEYYERGIRSDILIKCNGKKYALEIQMSPISLFKLIDRNVRYINNTPDIIPIWLLNEFPKRICNCGNLGMRRTLYYRYFVYANEIYIDGNDKCHVKLSKNRSVPISAFIYNVIKNKSDRNYLTQLMYSVAESIIECNITNQYYIRNIPENFYSFMIRDFEGLDKYDMEELKTNLKYIVNHEWSDFYDGEYPNISSSFYTSASNMYMVSDERS